MHFPRRHGRENAVKVRAHPIRDHGTSRAEPVVASHGKLQACKLVGWDQRAPHQNVGELSLFRPPKRRTHGRVNAIGTHHYVGLDPLPADKIHPRPIGGLANPGYLGTESDSTRRQLTREHVNQVGAMNVVHRRTIALGCFRAERRKIQSAASDQIAVVKCIGLRGNGSKVCLNAQFTQQKCAIACYLYAGAYLRQFFRLLENYRVYAVVPQRQRRTKSSDARAYNDHSHVDTLLARK